MRHQQRKSPSSSLDPGKLPQLPQFKEASGLSPHLDKPRLDQAVALQNLSDAFGFRLTSTIQTIKTVGNIDEMKKEKLKQIEESLKEKKKELMVAKSVPRGVWELADQIAINKGQTAQKRTTINSLGKSSKQYLAWRKYVGENFDDLAASIPLQQEQPNKKDKDNALKIRTCTTKLSKLFRDDLTEELQTLFMEKIDDAALRITDDISELAAIVRATMLNYVTNDLDCFPVKKLVDSSQTRDKSLLTNDCLPISRPDMLSVGIEDYENLFTQQHIQFIHPQHLGSYATKADDIHELWANLRPTCFDLPTAPSGMFSTLNKAIQNHAKDISNIYDSNIFSKSLEYVTRILLRLKLAPKRESHYKEMIKRLAKEKNDKKRKQSNKTLRNSQKRRLYEEKKFYQKCEDRLVSANDEDEHIKWQTRRYQSQQRLQKIHEEWDARLQRTQSRQECSLQNPSDESDIRQKAVSFDQDDDHVCNVMNVEALDIAQEKAMEFTMDETKTHDSHGAVNTFEDETEDVTEDKQNENTIKNMLERGACEEDILNALESEDIEEDKQQQQEERQQTEHKLEKEPPSRQITRLKVITKRLLLSGLKEDIGEKDVVDIWNDDETLTTKEIEAVIVIVNALRPYIIAPKDSNRRSIAEQLHFVVLADSILRTVGYPAFACEISPVITPADIHTLHLDADAIFELFGSRDAPLHLLDYKSSPIRSTELARENKRALFGAFFSLEKIDNICKDHKLIFDNRISINSFKAARIQGYLKDTVHPATSKYKERKQKRPLRTTYDYIPGDKDYLEIAIAYLQKNVDQLQAEKSSIASLKKTAVKQFKSSVATIEKKAVKYFNDAQYKDYKHSQQLRRKRANAIHAEVQNKQALKETRMTLRAVKARLQTVLREEKNDGASDHSTQDTTTTASVPKVQKTKPTLNLYRCEDKVEYIDLKELKKEAKKKDRPLVFSGTDKGLCKMSVTVPFNLDRYNYHRTLLETQASDGQPYDMLPLPKPNVITAQQLNEISGSRRFSKLLEKRMARNTDVQDALDDLSRHSSKFALTQKEIAENQEISKGHRKLLQGFYQNPRIQRERWRLELSTKRVYKQVAAEERRKIQDEAGTRKSIPIMLVGTAGTATGSRIKGHQKRGGSKINADHRQHAVVGMTDENMTSKTCMACNGPISRPKGYNPTTKRRKAVNGSSLCTNTKCPLYLAGRATQNRDYQSAMCIAFAGAHKLLTGKTIHPFSRRATIERKLKEIPEPDIDE